MDLRLDQTGWPITWRFDIQAPWGATQQDFTCDVPALYDDLEASRACGVALWTSALAGASTASVALVGITTKCWKSEAPVLPFTLIPQFGKRGGATAPRERSACIKMIPRTPHALGQRRLYLPGVPLNWTTPEVLTKDGAEELQALARGLIIGLADPIQPPAARWMIAYPRMFEDGPLGAPSVGFRYVDSARVCLYVERCPSPSLGVWP